MEDRVPEFLELVEDDVGRVLLQLPALVVDLLHVRFAARRGDDLRADLLQPVEPLAGHLLRQDRDGRAAEERAVKRAAAAEIPRRGPGGLVHLRIKFAADQARHQAAKRRAHLVRPRGEIFPDQSDHARLDAGEGGRDLEVVHAAKPPRQQVVLPRDPKQVQRIHVPQANAFEARFNRRRDERRVAQLPEGGDDDAALATASSGSLDDLRVEALDDRRHGQPFADFWRSWPRTTSGDCTRARKIMAAITNGL